MIDKKHKRRFNNYPYQSRKKNYFPLASSGGFGQLLSVTYLGMLLAATDQIHSEAATPTAPKF